VAQCAIPIEWYVQDHGDYIVFFSPDDTLNYDPCEGDRLHRLEETCYLRLESITLHNGSLLSATPDGAELLAGLGSTGPNEGVRLRVGPIEDDSLC